jgi:transposase-like protein
MKSVNQLLEQQMHRITRQRIRACTQPGSLNHVVEQEMSAFLSDILNLRLKEEQEELLGRAPYERNGDNKKRNGHKSVFLKGFFKKIMVRKPVLRGKTPPSTILPLLRRWGNGMIAMLASRFWLRGTATRAVAEELNQVFGTKLHSCDISTFTEKLLPDIRAWLEKPIDDNIEYLFLDAIYLPARKSAVVQSGNEKKKGFTMDQALLAAIGIDEDGKKHVLGFLFGDRECSDSWNTILEDLLRRGLKRDFLRLVISDDHKAIQSAVKNTLGVPHQLCVIHKMRNTLVRVAKNHRSEFYSDFTAIYWAKSREKAFESIGVLTAKWKKLYPKAVQSATDRPEDFLRFMNEPDTLWKTLRSTNLIERFNRELRRRLNPAGAMHSENELWKLVWSVSVAQEQRWYTMKKKSVKELPQKQAIKLAV